MKKLLIFPIVLLLLSACETTNQPVEPKPSYVIEDIKKNMAQIVFLRPSGGIMTPLQAIVFDITDGQREIIGVAPAKSKFVINISPGKHRFLSANGQRAHIMDLNIEGGKRYYVLVRPIYGNGFQLRPIKHGVYLEFDYKNPEFENWKTSTKISVKKPWVDPWYEKFTALIEKTQEKALQDWSKKNDDQRLLLTLRPEDAE